jgi:mercuric ion transport protein
MNRGSVELVLIQGCPNARIARENLGSALTRAGRQAEWVEWDAEDPAIPAELLVYGSPTILVDGRDVTGAAQTGSAAACRADGAPAVSVILAALMG